MEKENHFKLSIDDTGYETLKTRKFAERKKFVPADPYIVSAFIPGVIREIKVKQGASVKKGDIILMLEAMKMLNQVKAPVDGVVESIAVAEGDMVRKNQLLLNLKP